MASPAVPQAMLHIRAVDTYASVNMKATRSGVKAVGLAAFAAFSVTKTTPAAHLSGNNPLQSTVESRTVEYNKILANKLLADHPELLEISLLLTGPQLVSRARTIRTGVNKIAAADVMMNKGCVSGLSRADKNIKIKDILWKEHVEETKPPQAMLLDTVTSPGHEAGSPVKMKADWEPPGAAWWAWLLFGPDSEHFAQTGPWLEDILKEYKRCVSPLASRFVGLCWFSLLTYLSAYTVNQMMEIPTCKV